MNILQTSICGYNFVQILGYKRATICASTRRRKRTPTDILGVRNASCRWRCPNPPASPTPDNSPSASSTSIAISKCESAHKTHAHKLSDSACESYTAKLANPMGILPSHPLPCSSDRIWVETGRYEGVGGGRAWEVGGRRWAASLPIRLAAASAPPCSMVGCLVWVAATERAPEYLPHRRLWKKA
jgi:hypothetical protein